MEPLGETPEVLGPAPSKYGSWLKVSPAPRAGGVPASFLAICASICAHTMTTDAVGKTAAPAVLTLFEKERPKAATVKDWLKDAKPSFSASERVVALLLLGQRHVSLASVCGFFKQLCSTLLNFAQLCSSLREVELYYKDTARTGTYVHTTR